VTATDYAQKPMATHAVRKYKGENPDSRQSIAFIAAGISFFLLFISVCGFLLFETSGQSYPGQPKVSYGPAYVHLYRNKLFITSTVLPVFDNDWESPDFLHSNEMIIRQTRLSDKDLRNIAKNSQFNKISFEYCDGITESGLTSLMGNRCMKSLSLEGSKLDEYKMQALAQGQFEILNLSKTSVPNSSLPGLLNNRNLRTLFLEPMNLTKEQVEPFTNAGFKWVTNKFVRDLQVLVRPIQRVSLKNQTNFKSLLEPSEVIFTTSFSITTTENEGGVPPKK